MFAIPFKVLAKASNSFPSLNQNPDSGAMVS